MDYDNYSNEELIRRIKELEKEKEKDSKEKQNLLRSHFYMTGYLGPWHWSVIKDEVVLNSIQREMFKPYNENATITFNDYLSGIHEEDRDFVEAEINRHIKGELKAVELEYRMLFKDEKYHWLYHRAEIDEVDWAESRIHMIGALLDVTDRHKVKEELNAEKRVHEKEAGMDFLTNLLNRRGFHKQLTQYFNRSSNKGKVTIAMFDIDNFKQANDTYGHSYGDQVLLDIANLIKEESRESDIVSRFGGDEFLVIFTDTSLSTAYKACDRIRQTIEDKYKDDKVKITISGGLKEYDQEDRDELIEKADGLLYRAKKEGKNKIIKD